MTIINIVSFFFLIDFKKDNIDSKISPYKRDKNDFSKHLIFARTIRISK